MKSKYTILLSVVMLVSFVACTKSNNSAPVNPNPNITINGNSTSLLGLSKAFYRSKLNNDSIIIANSSVTDSSVINNLSNTNNINSSANFLILSISSSNTISQSTYSSSSIVSTYFQVKGTIYKSLPLLPSSITIDTLNNTFVSGSYSSTVANVTNSLDVSTPTLTGRFKAYF